ncbi:hypothetical protein NEFER03_0502 [Nematocida sp. LUAm3]|nr:hypothetical protein NEFER03_0502 [Nematocida sp. LUAm3]KAI5175469.1 hypothetical protein NEFER02_1375 [Nematocida sp. LUAm2]KAI5178501.1 hypothetical protein NEFER01_1648 [Nematocida sp. LUAm1]
MMYKTRKEEPAKGPVARAQIIFGEKIVFMEFSSTCTLLDVFRKSILQIASFLKKSYISVHDSEINLEDFKEFSFYLEDFAGRHIDLKGKEKEFPSILLFFSYRLIIHIHLLTDVKSLDS